MKEPKSWIINTERLVLAPVNIDDAPFLFPLFANPDISMHMAWNAHTDLGQSQSFLEEAACALEKRKAVHWAVRKQRYIIGLVSLIDIRGAHRAIEYNRVELAYWLSPDQHRKGFMTEAGHAVIDFAFSEMELSKLIVAHHIGNAASEGFIRKLGFRRHYLEENAFRKNGVTINCMHYDLQRSAWELYKKL